MLQRAILLLGSAVRSLQLRGASPSWLSILLVRLAFWPILLLLIACLSLYVILHRHGLSTEVVTLHGAKLKLRLPHDLPLYLFMFRVWEPDISTFLARRLKPGDTFVDVGANIGYHSLLASQAVGETGHVVAIEPSRRAFTWLEENIALNPHARNVRTVNLAASDAYGKLPLYRGLEFVPGATTTRPAAGYTVEAEVEARPLDGILTPEEMHSARLIKIDVEGAELSVIGGLSTLIATCRPDTEFLIEISPRLWKDGRKPDAELEKFFDAGFVPYWIPNNYRPGRYLSPFRTRRPRRIRGEIKPLLGQMDLVLSRQQAEQL